MPTKRNVKTKRTGAVTLWVSRDNFHDSLVEFRRTKPEREGDYFRGTNCCLVCRGDFENLFGFLPKLGTCRRVTVTLET